MSDPSGNLFDSDSQRQAFYDLSRAELERHQWKRLTSLIDFLARENEFYRQKLGLAHLASLTPAMWQGLPYTEKQELLPCEDSMGLARNHSWSIDRYCRYHRTSGTQGKPLAILDSREDWRWWISTWQYVLQAAEVTARDIAVMAFSFGPFIGFWSAHEAIAARGGLVIPAGGMSTLARLDLIASTKATIVCCTPSYALHMAEAARQHGVPLDDFSVRKIIVAGEPGGSLGEVRDRIESMWQAQVVDHAGATEIGPWGVGTEDGKGLYVIESEFHAEFLPVASDSKERFAQTSASLEGLCELVLTPLGRFGCPLVRYRTGDLVRPITSTKGFVRLQGGVLGRLDDMIVVRGVNVFPSSLEAILRSFPEVTEFRITATRQSALDQLLVEVEDERHDSERIAERIQLQLGLRVEVREVESGSLPRFEGKARRFIDLRATHSQ